MGSKVSTVATIVMVGSYIDQSIACQHGHCGHSGKKCYGFECGCEGHHHSCRGEGAGCAGFRPGQGAGRGAGLNGFRPGEGAGLGAGLNGFRPGEGAGLGAGFRRGEWDRSELAGHAGCIKYPKYSQDIDLKAEKGKVHGLEVGFPKFGHHSFNIADQPKQTETTCKYHPTSSQTSLNFIKLKSHESVPQEFKTHEFKPHKSSFDGHQPHGKNLLLNGDFQEPIVQNWTSFPGGIKGWKSKNLQLGKGNIYNPLWGNTQIVELDSNENQVITQSVNLPGNQQFTLSFDWAARSKHVASSGGQVYWNGKLLKYIVPTEQSIHHETFTVDSIEGENILEVRGTLASDSYGLGVDNFWLEGESSDGICISKKRHRNRKRKEYLLNGDFQQPKITNPAGWFIQKSSIPGWQGNSIELGKGTIYNSRWGNTQIVELDSDSNQKITQTVSNLSPGATYVLSYKWAARVNCLKTSGGNVYWNDKLLESIVPQDEQIHHSHFDVVAASGDNVIRFEGTLGSDGLGLGIDDVSLTGYEEFETEWTESHVDGTVHKTHKKKWICTRGGKWVTQIQSGQI